MRLALAHSHVETLGGGERALLELTRGLEPRHEVRLVVGRFVLDQTYPELGRFPRQVRRPWEWFALLPATDVVVANSFGANLLALRSGSRVIYWVHSLRGQFLRGNPFHPALAARRLLDWLAVRRDARLVANSAYVAARLPSLYGRPADAVVHPGVDLERFRPPPLGATASGAITVGRLAPEKGIERLLDLFRALPEITLMVVGDGLPDAVHHLHQLAPPNVRFAGPLSGDALARAYQGASVAVFMPHDEEFGLAPLEAMACGVPVVAVAEGGLTETVVSGETGYLSNEPHVLRDRIEAIASDPALRSQLSRAARLRAERFSWAKTVDQMERLCQELCPSPRTV